MPELPEVETIASDLRPHLVGRTIVSCELRFPTIVRHPEPEVFADLIAGHRIESVKRRGKYILIALGDERLLVVHLGMTGQLRLVSPETPIPNHTHAIFTLDDGRQLRYRDPRRPDRIAGGVSRKSARRLHESLRDSLETAIRNRGSSVDTYRDAWGEVGGQQEVLLVYGRAGQPCYTCGRPLSSVRIAGRTTVFCRRCQH